MTEKRKGRRGHARSIERREEGREAGDADADAKTTDGTHGHVPSAPGTPFGGSFSAHNRAHL